VTPPHEGDRSDDKSLRIVTGNTADYRELACNVVCFANGNGGVLRIGIEDGQDLPPPDQRIQEPLVEKIRKRILERIEPHRLKALIVEDLGRYPASSSTDIQRRVAPEVHVRSLRRALKELMEEGAVMARGDKRWRRYSLTPSNGQEPS